MVAETDLASHVSERQRVDHALAKVGELALGRVPESSVGHVGDRPTQHGIAEELQALVALRTRMFGDPRTVVQRLPEESTVSEDVPDPCFEDAELVGGVDGLGTVVQAIARSWT